MKYKLSPSELTFLYEGCKFCFWLKIKHGVPQPTMPMPAIFSVIADLQDRYYSGKRTEDFCKELPPGVMHLGEEWVESQPISFEGMEDQCFIKGRFDAVVKFDDKSYGIIDFKTSKPSEDKALMYGRQLQAYAYALENPSSNSHYLKPITKMGLLFFTPDSFDQPDFENQVFTGKMTWVEVKRDDDKFLKFLKEVVDLLKEEKPPQPDSNCGWCRYRDRVGGESLEKLMKGVSKAEDPNAPECPKCQTKMRLRSGKFGDFWSCPRYPDCRGTRNVSKAAAK